MRALRQPLVSVVIPTRDRHSRLARALSSVVSQTYRTLEVMVVDDGSDPPVADVVGRVAGLDRRVEVLRNETPMGASAARNRALHRCRGEVVAFLDDDDWWSPHKVERQVAAFTSTPQAGIVTADFDVRREGCGRVTHFRGPRLLRRDHLGWFNLPGSFLTGMVRRDAVDGELWLDESFPSVEDWDFWLRCARRTSIVVVPEVLGSQCLHNAGRLSDPVRNLPGLVAFEQRHGDALSAVCRAFLRAHQGMEQGVGWSKRWNVARSLVTTSPRASALLLLEQWAVQIGRIRRDPGLPQRVLVRALGQER